ncbi:baculo_p74_N domain-containing protein [Trichonephila inaurata madagascariensis]|uniref:Baculo_p74_N domain-containing protein n=1 Tax=Trichonephila inaurata madagascariensis TaxID=2747483 RepID=A0A8X6XJV1_9ARAC|nr:baculo_p74_N domain-containing protein [Trichonephila inaurata madagascariensis]
MQWTRLANTLVLSCQPSCREMTTSIDAEWWGSRCVMVNPLKKVLASFPEQIFGMQSKHPLHAGLDWRNGQIYLNKLYCQAYGLEFDGKECYSSVDQTIGEFFLGKTVYRALKTSVVQPPNYAHIPPIPSHPAVSLEVNLSDTIPLPETSQVAREVTTELLADFGVDIAAHVVEKILWKKAPQLLLKAAGNFPIQSTLTQAVLNQTLSLSVKSLTTAGKIMAGASNIMAVYSVILDILDPFHYENVLTADALDAINKRLDLVYFQRKNNFNPEITPEMVWDNLLGEEDESDLYEFMANKIQEYLTALQANDKINYETTLPVLKHLNMSKQNQYYQWTLRLVIVLMMVILGMLFVQYVQVWAVVILFVLFTERLLERFRAAAGDFERFRVASRFWLLADELLEPGELPEL